MQNTIPLNINKLTDFANAMRDKISTEDFNLLAIKAMALSNLYVDLNNPNQIANAIAQAESELPQAFLGSHYPLGQFKDNIHLIDFIGYLNDAKEKGILTPTNQKTWLKTLLTGRGHHHFVFDDSFYALCVMLFNQMADDELYLPFETGFYHSMMFAGRQQIFAEGLANSPIPALLNIIFGKVQYVASNAITNPAYVQNGQLQKFAKGFLADPWGIRATLSDSENERFAVVSNNQQSYLIQHLLSQINGLGIIAVPANTLSSSVGSEIQLREWLMNSGHLKAVLTMPSGLLARSSVAFALMIVDCQKVFDKVMMINLNDSEFVAKNNDRRALTNVVLTNLTQLVELIDDNSQNACAKLVDKEIILQNACVLSPERYVLDDNAHRALSVLENYPLVKLKELVEIVRPIANPRLRELQEGEHSVVEVQGGDLPPFGYIDIVSKENLFDDKSLNICEPYFLKEHDIIMTVRGTTGKVGIVSKTLLDNYNGQVLAGQTGFVLRAKNDKMHPIALFMQLQNKLTQSRLSLISSGAIINNLSVRDLGDFELAMLTYNEQQKLIATFDEQNHIKAQITEQQKQLQALADGIWD